MKFTINIGSKRSPKQAVRDPDEWVSSILPVAWREARAALRAVGFKIHGINIVPGVDEATYVVGLDASDVPAGEVYMRLHAVSIALHQDCIAVRAYDDHYTPAVKVHECLIGPDAAAWAPFNPEYFKELP